MIFQITKHFLNTLQKIVITRLVHTSSGNVPQIKIKRDDVSKNWALLQQYLLEKCNKSDQSNQFSKSSQPSQSDQSEDPEQSFSSSVKLFP